MIENSELFNSQKNIFWKYFLGHCFILVCNQDENSMMALNFLTILENIAKEEVESSLRSIELIQTCFNDFMEDKPNSVVESDQMQMLLWSQLHGIISLHNNNLLDQVYDSPYETAINALKKTYQMLALGMQLISMVNPDGSAAFEWVDIPGET